MTSAENMKHSLIILGKIFRTFFLIAIVVGIAFWIYSFVPKIMYLNFSQLTLADIGKLIFGLILFIVDLNIIYLLFSATDEDGYQVWGYLAIGSIWIALIYWLRLVI